MKQKKLAAACIVPYLVTNTTAVENLTLKGILDFGTGRHIMAKLQSSEGSDGFDIKEAAIPEDMKTLNVNYPDQMEQVFINTVLTMASQKDVDDITGMMNALNEKIALTARKHLNDIKEVTGQVFTIAKPETEAASNFADVLRNDQVVFLNIKTGTGLGL